MKNMFKIFLCLFLGFTTKAYSLDNHTTSSITSVKDNAIFISNASINPAEMTKNSAVSSEGGLDELKAKAEAGDVEAQLNLGYIYLYGIDGVNIDYKQALAYYEAAARQNSPVAYNNLGSLYFSGIGTDVDYSKAIHFFDEAAKLGSKDAAVNLAVIYLNSQQQINTDENLDKALALLQQASSDNNIAKYLLGYAYSKGFLVPQNMRKAFQLIKAAADAKYDEAQYVLADFYIKGQGVTKNYTRAVEYLQQAADQGNLLAMMKLADILAEGKIYKKDIKKAHIFYNIASVMGDKEAPQKRDALEGNMDIEDLLAIQAQAEDFKPHPSEQTVFIRKTFGESLKTYIDSNIIETAPKKPNENKKEK